MNPATCALELCDRISALSDVPGTITRFFLSPATREAHALLTHEMQALGMQVRTDAAGNLRGIYRAAQPTSRTLLLGSHIDTVPDAGPYDGILGVTLALALIASLAGRRLAFNLELIAFSEEEGVRFRMPFLGSRALTPHPVAGSLADADGITMAQALASFGVDPNQPTTITPGTFAFVEVHIEQGPVLESQEVPLGIVTVIAGQTRLELTFLGQANHAGTTPMRFRRDALAAAAQFLTSVEALTNAYDPALVATVGVIQSEPGAPNVIPGRVTLSLDIRHADDCTRLRFRRVLTAEARRIAGARGLAVRIRQTSQQDAVPMDDALTAALTQAARAAGFQPHAMPSGAGHDAMILAPYVPTAMLFVRTPGGLSHHPNEAVQVKDVEAALETMTELLRFFDLS